MATHRHPVTPSASKKSTNNAKLVLIVTMTLATILGLKAEAVTYKVHSDRGSGSESGAYDLGEAMALAKPGDTVSLADGRYDRALVTKADGEDGNPITIEGGEKAVINGDFSSRSVLVQHSHITLKVSQYKLCICQVLSTTAFYMAGTCFI